MNPAHFLLEAWSTSAAPYAACAVAIAAYALAFRDRARWLPFGAAVAVVLVALVSPLSTLAAGTLFSAHMVQHLLLLLVAPALLLISLPHDLRAPGWLVRLLHPAVAWTFGVVPMWLWHVPALCDAAALNPAVRSLQTVSLLAMGTVFWWPILAPRASARLVPLSAVMYLFAACLGCSALGILLTLTPVEVCTVYRTPADPWRVLGPIRQGWGMSPEADRQIGGLLMWVPMCLVYVGAILMEVRRWLSGSEPGAASTTPFAGGGQ